MMRRWLVLLIALLPCAAWAQDAAAEAETDEDTPPVAEEQDPEGDHAYSLYEAPGFGFEVVLPDSGTITNPDSAGWDRDPQVAFLWRGAATDPVALILARVDQSEIEEEEITSETFQQFCDLMVQDWKDEGEKVELGLENYSQETANHTWHLTEVTQTLDDEVTKVYYSVFVTYSGPRIFTLVFYYREPFDEEIRLFGLPVLTSFKATEVP